jgi:hypothetical protein
VYVSWRVGECDRSTQMAPLAKRVTIFVVAWIFIYMAAYVFFISPTFTSSGKETPHNPDSIAKIATPSMPGIDPFIPDNCPDLAISNHVTTVGVIIVSHDEDPGSIFQTVFSSLVHVG